MFQQGQIIYFTSFTVPSFVTIPHGCINLDERCYNCYLLEKDKVICENGFSFELATFIYGDQVEDYEIEKLEEKYKIRGVDYEIPDTLTDNEYQAIIKCLLNSGSVKRKIKKHLQ